MSKSGVGEYIPRNTCLPSLTKAIASTWWGNRLWGTAWTGTTFSDHSEMILSLFIIFEYLIEGLKVNFHFHLYMINLQIRKITAVIITGWSNHSSCARESWPSLLIWYPGKFPEWIRLSVGWVVLCKAIHSFFFYKKLFYKKVSLIFTEKLRNPSEIFEAQMKIPNKKVGKKLPK